MSPSHYLNQWCLMDPYVQDSQNIYLTGELRAVYSNDV